MPENNSQDEKIQKEKLDQELETLIKESGFSAEEVSVLKKALESGKVIPKPSSPKELPADLRKELDALVESRTMKEIQKVKDQLYASMETKDGKIDELSQYIKKLQEQEAAEKKRLADEEEEARKEKLTLKQRLEELQKAKDQDILNLKSDYENKLAELASNLRKTQLLSARDKLVSLYGDELFVELLPDIDKNPSITEEELAGAVKASHEKYKEYFTKFSEKIASEKETIESQSPELPSTRPFNSPVNKPYLGNQGRQKIDIESLNSKEDLDKALDMLSADLFRGRK